LCEHPFSDDLAGRAYTRLKRALQSGNAHLALGAAAEVHGSDLLTSLSLLLVIVMTSRPLRQGRDAWLARNAAEDRYLLRRDARDLVDLLNGVGRHDQVAARQARAVAARARL
jgi:hypothetical protein